MTSSALPSRRRFLGALGGSFVVTTATSLGTRLAGAVPARTIPRGGAPFAQPEELVSAGGRLDVELVARASKVPFGDGERFAYTFNGATPGPTLRVRPGDTLTITLVNRIGESTNLHTHGLHVSPSGNADNVFVSVPDGTRRTYTYEIPGDHRSGTFWYHPHMHEMVAPQLSGGLAGAIVVADELDDLPALVGATQRVLVLSDPSIGASSDVVDVSMMEKMRGREGDVVLVNGAVSPVITARAGTLEHWRIVNASASRYYRLALEGHDLPVVATDGGRLATPHEVSELLLSPGERAELLVAPSSPGRHRLQALPYDRGALGMGMGGRLGSTSRVVVATMAVTGEAPAAPLPATLASAESLAVPVATGRRELALAMGMGGGMPGSMGGGGMGRSFTIDGRTFDPSRTDIATRLGRVEEWTITNSSSMDHPFHLHVWPFQVVARSDGGSIVPGWKDTVNVPAGESVTFRVPLVDIGGRTVYHCHILDHEDLGMMGVIRVAP